MFAVLLFCGAGQTGPYSVSLFHFIIVALVLAGLILLTLVVIAFGVIRYIETFIVIALNDAGVDWKWVYCLILKMLTC